MDGEPPAVVRPEIDDGAARRADHGIQARDLRGSSIPPARAYTRHPRRAQNATLAPNAGSARPARGSSIPTAPAPARPLR